MARQLPSPLKLPVITLFPLLLSITLMANLSTAAYLQACLQKLKFLTSADATLPPSTIALIEPAWKNWWMALLTRKLVHGRISMEGVSQYLAAGIQNCWLLQCYLFLPSLHVPDYYFLYHISMTFPPPHFIHCHQGHIVGRHNSDIDANFRCINLCCKSHFVVTSDQSSHDGFVCSRVGGCGLEMLWRRNSDMKYRDIG